MSINKVTPPMTELSDPPSYKLRNVNTLSYAKLLVVN